MRNLETQRLVLRKFNRDDFEAVHSYASVKENMIYMPWNPNTLEVTKQFIENAIALAEKEPCFNYEYAIVIKSTNQLIGGCHLTITGNQAEIGWMLHRDYWKQGFGYEVGQRLLQFGFDDLKIHRIVAICDAENIGSYRIMEKIGLIKEGLYYDARPAHKNSNRQYSDELHYGLTLDRWNTKKKISEYQLMTYHFNNFIDVPHLTDDDIQLICIAKQPMNPEKKWVPSYNFIICKGSEKIGVIDLRIGYIGGIHHDNLYYGGHIGYTIFEQYRGNNYAMKACRLLLPVAKAHQMKKLLITNAVTNVASRRVCEKLGLKLIDVARLPEYSDIYEEGHRFMNIFEWDIESEIAS